MAIGIATLKERFARARAKPPIARGVQGNGICRNCGAAAPGEYCPACGQETRIALPTFREFMRDAMGRLIALDGRLWRTLFGLVFRPGFLTMEYFAGRRRRYVRPGRLFLVMSLLLFAVVGFVASPGDFGSDIVIVKSDESDVDKALAATSAPARTPPSTAGKAPDPPSDQALSDAQRKAKTKELATAKAVAAAKAKQAQRKAEGVSEPAISIGVDDELNVTFAGLEKALPPVLQERYVHFKQLSQRDKAERLYSGLLRYGPYAMFVLLPAFALLQMLVYLGRSRRYPTRPRFYSEHLVYSAHVHAFAFLMIMLFVVIPFGFVKFALAAWLLYYLLRARALVYGGRWWAGVLRSFLIAITYAVLVTLAIMGLLMMAVMLR